MCVCVCVCVCVCAFARVHVHSEVSCKSLEGMEGLRLLLYQVACSMKDHSTSSSRGQRLVGRLVRPCWNR